MFEYNNNSSTETALLSSKQRWSSTEQGHQNSFGTMIVTAFPRSGGTIHCMQLAKELNRSFADEPFQWSIQGKPKIHEAYDESSQSTEFSKDYVLAHQDQFVALNHYASESLLAKSESFLVRQDLSQVCESWIDLFLRSRVSADVAYELFLDTALVNIRAICEHVLNTPSKVELCEKFYSFTYREPHHVFKLQNLVDEVYAKYK